VAVDQAVTRGYFARQERLAKLFAQRVQFIWDRLPGYDTEDEPRFIESVDPVVAAGQRQSMQLTAAYLGVMSETVASSELADLELRAPFIALRTHLASGGEWERALEVGQARAFTLGQNAVVSAADQVIQSPADGRTKVGYRRTAKTPSCDWCLRMAGRYELGDNDCFRRHDRCDCVVTPIYEDSDPAKYLRQRRRK
jgi:hypothetical protein